VAVKLSLYFSFGVCAGPRGFIRSLQAANAVATLAQEQILQGQLDPPQTVLRKLFEKLGATYIKLGQVCRCQEDGAPAGCACSSGIRC
jgi:predicted unusual protein kinase regulating ubiquinone biosynthesis (AarF/ABC1/UbiB family)